MEAEEEGGEEWTPDRYLQELEASRGAQQEAGKLEKERHARELREVESKLKDREKELGVAKQELEAAERKLDASTKSSLKEEALEKDLLAAKEEAAQPEIAGRGPGVAAGAE